MVRLLGGELRVESVPGRGSRFFFDLPLRSDGGDDPPHDVVSRHRSAPEGITAPRIASPPPADIQALLTLSLEGDIVRLRTRLAEIAANTPVFADFAREIEALAVGFRMDAISEYLRHVSKEEKGE